MVTFLRDNFNSS